MNNLFDMKPDSNLNTTDPEKDEVWELLRQASTRTPSPHFVDDLIRLSRLDGENPRDPWWSRWFSPVPAFTAVALAASVAIGMFIMFQSTGDSIDPFVTDSGLTEADFTHLQDALEVEMLIAAAENPEAVSDEELLTLIGL